MAVGTKRSWAWVFGLLPVLLVGAAMGGYLWWGGAASGGDRSGGDASGRGASGGGASGLPGGELVPGHDYYLFVRTVELYPTTAEGKAWDRVGNSAPDIFYELLWQDLVVYTSPVRDDTLIAAWDPISVDVRGAILGGKIDLASVLNQGAIVNAGAGGGGGGGGAGGSVTIHVWDQDLFGLGNEGAGSHTVGLEELRVGDNVFTFEHGPTNAVKRIVLRVTDTDQPVQSLLDALGAP